MNGNLFRTIACLWWLASGSLLAQAPVPAQSSADFLKYAEKLRETTILNLDPTIVTPTTARPTSFFNRYPWKTGIVTRLFWIGRGASDQSEGGRGSLQSAWDPKWVEHYGGYDDPDPAKRGNFAPAGFVPKLNPFYVALPYNDVDEAGMIKPEAKVVIPWFREAFTTEGESVCRDRWVAIRNSTGKICFAQWSDCGPFETDHWQYVFGNENPKPNAEKGAGLSVSPAVRAYLELEKTDVTDWKFVEFRDVSQGPWALFGENNLFVPGVRRARETVEAASAPNRANPPTETPKKQ